jgi:hypothetical protein
VLKPRRRKKLERPKLFEMLFVLDKIEPGAIKTLAKVGREAVDYVQELEAELAKLKGRT